MCIYMAEHMKSLENVVAITPKENISEQKGFPGNNARRRLGISFYNSLIKDNRRFKICCSHESPKRFWNPD